MMKPVQLIDFHRENFLFHDWANSEILKAIFTIIDSNTGELLPVYTVDNLEGSKLLSHILKLFNHTINANEIWLNRIKGENILIDPLVIYSITEMEKRSKNVSEITNDFLSSLDDSDLLKIISYKNLQGQNFQNTIHKIFIHIVNHGVYHRGQIASQMRQLGIAPPPTDMIVYYRNKRK